MIDEYDSVKSRFAVVKNACNTRNLIAENNIDNKQTHTSDFASPGPMLE